MDQTRPRRTDKRKLPVTSTKSPERSHSARPKTSGTNRRKDGRASPAWNLRLYVAGQTPRSITAFSNLKKICEEHLVGQYSIEVVDLLANPQLARGDQILAVPTLVRKLPEPVRKIIGDMSNTERVLVGLDLRPRS